MLELLGSGLVYALGRDALMFLKDGKDFVELSKDLLGFKKDLEDFFNLQEGEAKLVDFNWAHESGFQNQLESQGYQVSFIRPEKIASRVLNGFEIMYEINTKAKTKHKIILYDGMILIGKKSKN